MIGRVTYGTLFVFVAVACTAASAQGKITKLAPAFPVDGEPLLGTYAVSTLEDLKLVDAANMNAVIAGHNFLDTNTPEGAYCRDHGIKVMLHLTEFIYGVPRLREHIDATQTSIPLDPLRGGSLPAEGGVVQIDGERIRYGAFSPKGLTECTRGVDGTQSAEHREGVILFQPEPAADAVREAMTSDNLYGYYVLDDSPGDALSALQALYATIRDVDPDVTVHPVAAGYGSEGSLANFAPGVCDVALFYWYPITAKGVYDRLMISRNVQWMLTTARGRVPGLPYIGVYQTFWEADQGQKPPTPELVREQIEDFVREGACGLIAFACHLSETFPGWSASDAIQATLRDVHATILEEGGLSLPDQPEEMAEHRIQPVGSWERPREIAGLVPAMYILGPFDDAGRGLDAALPEEPGWDVDGVYDGKSGPIRWILRDTQSGVVGLGELYGSHSYTKQSVAYAQCTISSDGPREAVMLLGRDDDLRVWLGEDEVVRLDGSHGLERDEYAIPVTIPEGATPLRIQCANREGMWGFAIRFVDRSGNPLKGLKFGTNVGE